MMIHKKFIRYFVMDYHRIYDVIRCIQRINPPLNTKELEDKINNLFDGIETEKEVFDTFKLFRYNAIIKKDKIILTNDTECDDDCNPAYPEQPEEYVLARYILKNFLIFRQAFTDCVMGKFPNDLEFWIYACHYLLMDNKEFDHLGFGPDGKNFSYKIDKIQATELS